MSKSLDHQLQSAIRYVADHSPYYRELFLREGIDPNSILGVADLKRLPFTDKEQLQLRNKDFYCVPPRKIVDYVTSSGTLGEPVTVVLTENDLERLAYNEAESLKCTGGSHDDIYQLMCTLDRRFMAGLAYFLGARKLGAGVVRTGAGLPELQWDTIRRIQPTVLITVPSMLLKIIDYAEEKGIDYKSCSVKKAICIGEPVRDEDFKLNVLGQKIRERWNIELYSTYASTEMAAAFTECEGHTGGHFAEGLVIPELVDEEGNPVADGEAGELVITTLGVEGMPLIRFRTGDICRGYSSPCSCGRLGLRLGPILGRKKQMIKYKGTTLYPPAVFNILNKLPEVENYILEVSTGKTGLDELLVRVGADGHTPELEKLLREHFQSGLRVIPVFRFEKPGSIAAEQMAPLSRKPIVFIDKRTNFRK